MNSYAPSYYLSPPQSPPQESSLYQPPQNQYLHPYQQQQEQQKNYQQPQHHDRPTPPPLLSVKVLFETSGNNNSNGGSGRRVSIGFRNTQQAEHYGQFVRAKTIHHTERLSCKVQGRYVSVRLPHALVACLAGPGAGASRVGGFYFVFSDLILAQEWVDCLLLWRYVPGSKRKLYVERDVRDDVLDARLGMMNTTSNTGGGPPVVQLGGNDTVYQQYQANLTSPVSLLAPSKASTTEEVVTIYSAEGEEVVSPGLEFDVGSAE
ncbi:hypothetical protein PG993_007269 [Apiospora rasikravindrae]|uniref:Velvet domain-containing protein n=1 Tax=Apiospora rasikravindrae TaxID=990691 RepID=A0ABR1SX27_9PEZI